ncbi:MAG: glycosyltransferase [Limnothrix sp. RL_2_0]|nr:glycosyltransferase [Limnothrix sp. RL_2_0]
MPDNKKVLLCAAQNFKDPRKGGDLLLKALKNIPDSLKQTIVLLVLGEGGEVLEGATDISTMTLGYIGGDRIKAAVYSAADIFVFPTRADNLPLVLQESIACGTPVVSFNIGGVPEVVRPNITGLLAQAKDAIDFLNELLS